MPILLTAKAMIPAMLINAMKINIDCVTMLGTKRYTTNDPSDKKANNANSDLLIVKLRLF